MGVTFSVTTPVPAITGVNPTSGAVGTSVTITGVSFGTVPGTVRFNGTAAAPTSWGTTSIVVPVPAGATTGPVVVTVNGAPSNGVTFDVLPSGGTQVPALVQHAGRDAGTTTSSSLAFTANNTAGNWIAVVIRAGRVGQVFTVTDTRGNTYRRAIQYNESIDATTLGLFYAESIAGGANTISVSDSISGGTLRFAILEYSGVATANSLDVTATAQGTSNAPGTGTVTTTASGDLVIGVLSTAEPRTFTAGSGYVIQERVPVAPNTKLVVEDRILATAGPVSANGTLNSSDTWGAALAAFRPAVGGGGPIPAITGVNPTSGAVGTSVTITGANFGTTPGTVRFNGTVAAPTSWGTTSIVVPVPAGATTGPVVVTVNGAASNGVTFSVTPGPDTQAPTAPGNLTATAVGGSQIDLNWIASTDNVGVTQYRVEQCHGVGCSDFTEIAAVNAASPPVAAPLSASANPNYFKDASGTPIILNGSHSWNTLQDWGTNGVLQPLDFTAFVNFLVAHGHNFTYLWRTELPKFCNLPTTASAPPSFTVGPHPWQRTGPGNASDGGLKFDLTKFNQAYFDRLRARVQALNAAGIYAGVYLFTGEWLAIFRCASDGYPFTGSNNINGIDDGGGTGSMTMTSPNAITAFQDAFVEKTIDTLNDIPNVLWLVSEEGPVSTTWWNDHQISHLRSYQSTKPYRHPIGYGVPLVTGGDSIIVNSDADWINPQSRISPVSTCGGGTPACKVNVNDSDHSYWEMWHDSAQANRLYAWENFTNGNQVVFMDPYLVHYPRETRNLCISQVNGVCASPDTRWDNFRDNLGYILRYSRKLNLANVRPRESLSSTSSCLAQTPTVGAEYLIYAPNGGTFTVDLSAMSSSRTLTVEWFNPATGATIAAGLVPAGSSSRSFTTPFSGDAVLYLVDAAGHAGVPAAPPASYSVTGLGTGVYGYRVRAVDGVGNLGPYSNVVSATIQTSDTQAPTTPTGLAGSAIAPTQVNLSWSAATDDTGVTGYPIYRDTIHVATSSTPSFQDTGLVRGTTYSYSVAARDAVGNVSVPSTPITAATPAFAISNVQASGITTAKATITWNTDQPSNSQVEYGATAVYGQNTAIDSALTTNHSQELTGLGQNSTYHYRVRSRDSVGRLITSGDFTFTTTSTGTAGAFQNEILISGMTLPTSLAFLPDGDMLILELGGRIWELPEGTTQVRTTPFLSLTNVGGVNSQQGLMGMVLDPSFASNRYYYVFYTLGTPNRDRVSRFTATADHLGTVAGSEFVLYEDPQNANAEHHGGALNFGGDGKLYITTGEHFDPAIAQNLTSPRGKILRINSNGTIPTDNPFYDGAGPNRDEIWARGLRNPFRASYDSLSGRLYVADVGGNDYSTAQEEVNLGIAGANYGWPSCEGSSCGGNPQITTPIYSYPHNGRDASITGGVVYRGSAFPPQYYGNYFFADYAQNWIRRLTFDASGNVSGMFYFEPIGGSPDGPYGDIVYLTEGPDGALYYVDLGYSDTTGQTGISKIRRIRFIPDNRPPTAESSAVPREGAAPLVVNFSSSGSADPEGNPLTYLWNLGDGATSTEANPAHTYTEPGQYAVTLTVSDGNVNGSSTPLLISVGNKPVAEILSPTDSVFFHADETIFVSGDATDSEDGILPASAFTWNIEFLHAGHAHPEVPTVGTKRFDFDIPVSGHDFSGDTRYRITLTVTDSDGLQASQSVIIYPEKVDLSFASDPSSLVVNFDGIPKATPFVHDTLIGFTHTIDAPNQSVAATGYTFGSWSDGGAQQHTIFVPSVDQSYTASYNTGPLPYPPGLVAGYRFDEGTGTATADVSANNTSGSLVNAPVWTIGRYGNGLQFGGSNYVDLGNPGSLRLTGSMTLSAWIYISANPSDDAAIVAKLGAAGWQLKTSPDTGVRTAAIQISSNGANSIQRYSSTVLAANVWYHIAGVYDAASRALDIYVNGVLSNGVLSGTVPAAQVDSNLNVNIAQRTGYPGIYNFLGRIDEVHVYNRALSASEVGDDMNHPR